MRFLFFCDFFFFSAIELQSFPVFVIFLKSKQLFSSILNQFWWIKDSDNDLVEAERERIKHIDHELGGTYVDMDVLDCRPRDVYSLREGIYATGTVIDTFIGIFEKSVPNNKCLRLLSSYFQTFESIEHEFTGFESSTSIRTSTRHWTREQVETYDILAPRHLPDHWILFVISVTHSCIYIMDTNSPREEHESLYQVLLRWYKLICTDKGFDRVVDSTTFPKRLVSHESLKLVPRQRDGYSCGTIVAILSAYYLLKKRFPTRYEFNNTVILEAQNYMIHRFMETRRQQIALRSTPVILDVDAIPTGPLVLTECFSKL